MRTYELVIPGPARPKKRPVVLRSGHTYTPDPHKYVELIGGIAKKSGVQPTSGPVLLDITIYRKIPMQWNKKLTSIDKPQPGDACMSTPDGINVAANYWDALEHIAYNNDKQVTQGSVIKFWALEDSVEVTIVQLEED